VAAWTDPSGNFWLFGGVGDALSTNSGLLNDFWKYSSGQWAWMGGTTLTYQSGVYGTQGSPSPSNLPGARSGSVTWTDTSGNLWMFGGSGYDSAGSDDMLGDLWKYAAGQWTWVGGASVVDQKGVYGTQGVPSSANVPGARTNASAWTDPAGSFWIFGGSGYDSAGKGSNLSDLWKYAAGQWTWIAGPDVVNQPAAYGTQGVPAPTNVPSARSSAASWSDAAGNLWLYGGDGDYSADEQPILADLWEFSAGQWTWVGGSQSWNETATYGTPSVPAPANFPGSRAGAVTWTDPAGNLWLFGGEGLGSDFEYGWFSDLWKYSGGQWACVNGADDGTNWIGNYGTLGVPGGFDGPGARLDAIGWSDAAGNLWLFGGLGAGNTFESVYLSDLWKY